MARCVFVGNIPYDATEEQLIQICEEVGPVVSFRLVTDRETGKPKGYGFCEYKDEETALSARRNLLGYEINGRQLRIDFAENDKGPDKNREQGRGGPGMTATADPQKQVGGPAILGDSAHQQPFGLSLATTAASIMTGALGGAQVGNKTKPNGLYNQSGMDSDPITLHLAKLSRNQLNEILTDLKVMATDDKEVARQLLLTNPQLSKALFQAQILLGMVTPEMLHMPNIRQGALLQPSSQEAQPGRLPAFQVSPGLPPLTQNNGQFGMMPIVQEGQGSRVQMPHAPPTQFQQQPSFPSHTGISKLPSMNQKMQVPPPLLQFSGPNEIANPGHNRQPVNPTVVGPPLNRPPISDPSYQTQSSMISNILVPMRKDSDRLAQAINMISGPMKSNMVHNNSESLGRPSKLVKLDDGRSIPSSLYGLNGPTTSGSWPSHAIGMGSSSSVKQIPNAQNQQSEQQASQIQFAPEAESALLQQVMKLTPEQLRSLTPEQQQQVFQLQKMLR